MRLNHINLPVDDVAEARDFFETYFDFTYREIKGDGLIAVMNGTDGFVLVLMSSKFNAEPAQAYPSAFHIGFLLATRMEVEQKHAELLQGGIPLGGLAEEHARCVRLLLHGSRQHPHRGQLGRVIAASQNEKSRPDRAALFNCGLPYLNSISPKRYSFLRLA